MSKKDLISALSCAMASENASALCVQNVVSTFAWSGLPDDTLQQATDSLKSLATAPERRAERIKEILDRVTWSDSDVL